MPTFSVRVSGAANAARNLRLLATEGPKIMGTTLFREAERIMGEIKATHVPVDFGVLRNSGHVQPPTIHRGGANVVMAFGGPARKYALTVHEGVHPITKQPMNFRVGGANYLAGPVKANSARIQRSLDVAMNTAAQRLPKR